MLIDNSEFPMALRRPLVPNGSRRAPWHDYYDKSIYLITLNASMGIPAFSQIQGFIGNHDWPPRAVMTPLGELIAEKISELKEIFSFYTDSAPEHYAGACAFRDVCY